jgi:hypothetical protein
VHRSSGGDRENELGRLMADALLTASRLALAVDTLGPHTVDSPPLSLSLVRIPDAVGAAISVLRYTADLATAGQGPQVVQ